MLYNKTERINIKKHFKSPKAAKKKNNRGRNVKTNGASSLLHPSSGNPRLIGMTGLEGLLEVEKQ